MISRVVIFDEIEKENSENYVKSNQKKEMYENEVQVETSSNPDLSTVDSTSYTTPVQSPYLEISKRDSTEEFSSRQGSENTGNRMTTFLDHDWDLDYVSGVLENDQSMISSSRLEESAIKNARVPDRNQWSPEDWWARA